ncbi:hypothetical protein DTO282F9_5161 [Paecilomyces variotii]|nr:hypothetical protein DTO282F9_5161 [Paecilomyces variotii]
MESLRKPDMIQAMARSTECLQKLEYSSADRNISVPLPLILLFWYTKQASKKIDEMSAVATPALNDTLPKGDRKKRNNKATGKNVSTTKDDDGKKESLNIKIHLDLKVKVKLELDAEIYGDVVIGLL